MRVLFMCTANSCRSILSEAMFNHLAPQGFEAISAGSFPKGQVLPRSLSTLQEAGIAIDGLSSKGNEAFEANPPDIVITVCDSAAAETCPVFFSGGEQPPVKVHWGYPDPSNAEGGDEGKRRAFELTRQAIAYRMLQLLALPLERLRGAELAAALQTIARS